MKTSPSVSASLLALGLLLGLPGFAACDSSEEEELAAASEPEEEIKNIKVGLPPAPNFDDAKSPEKWEDGDYSIYGLRLNIDERTTEGDAGTEVIVKGYVQEIYIPPECAEDDPFCDLGKQPHFWITDKADQKGKKRAMMVVNYSFKIPEWEAEQWADAPQVILEKGKRYRIKGKFKRFSDTGFAHDRGLLEFVAYETEDAETGQKVWVYPPGAAWHPTTVALQEQQAAELAEKAAAAMEKKKG